MSNNFPRYRYNWKTKEPVRVIVKVVDFKTESPHAVKFLREVLKEAEQGKLAAVAICTINNDRTTNNAWCVDGIVHNNTLVGTLTKLQSRIMDE